MFVLQNCMMHAAHPRILPSVHHTQAYASYPPTILLERLRKRLRRFGFRVSLTLQMLPQVCALVKACMIRTHTCMIHTHTSLFCFLTTYTLVYTNHPCIIPPPTTTGL